MLDNLDAIKAEDWKDAPGITDSAKKGTNGGLAERDYSKDCKTTHRITVIHGFHIWWCSTHHQPLPWCERGKSRERVITFARLLIDRERGHEPSPGTKWKTVTEICSDFIKSVMDNWR